MRWRKQASRQPKGFASRQIYLKITITPHYRSGGRRQGSRAVFGGCFTLSAYFAKSKAFLPLYHKTHSILNIKPYSKEMWKKREIRMWVFSTMFKKYVVFFSKKGVLFFLSLYGRQKLRILIEDLTHISIKKYMTFTMGRRFDDGSWSRLCGWETHYIWR